MRWHARLALVYVIVTGSHNIGILDEVGSETRIEARGAVFVEAVLIWLLTVTIFTYSVPYSDHLSDHILPHYQCACCLTDSIQ